MFLKLKEFLSNNLNSILMLFFMNLILISGIIVCCCLIPKSYKDVVDFIIITEGLILFFMNLYGGIIMIIKEMFR